VDDIVAVNGQPAKGTVLLSWRTMTLSPTPPPGAAIADVSRNNYIEVRAEILQADATPVGSVNGGGKVRLWSNGDWRLEMQQSAEQARDARVSDALSINTDPLPP
jgi:hypothetical protein